MESLKSTIRSKVIEVVSALGFLIFSLGFIVAWIVRSIYRGIYWLMTPLEELLFRNVPGVVMIVGGVLASFMFLQFWLRTRRWLFLVTIVMTLITVSLNFLTMHTWWLWVMLFPDTLWMVELHSLTYLCLGIMLVLWGLSFWVMHVNVFYDPLLRNSGILFLFFVPFYNQLYWVFYTERFVEHISILLGAAILISSSLILLLHAFTKKNSPSK